MPPSSLEEATIFVTGFRFDGNSVFSDEQLLEVAQPYINREISFDELIDLRLKITDLYVDSGFTTSAAVITEQGNEAVSQKDAVVTIRIIEGAIEEVSFEGDDRLRSYVLSRLNASLTPVFNQIELEETLRLLQIDPLVESISANLSSGSQVGSSLLTISAVAAPIFKASIETNNHRAPSIGSFQAVVQAEVANLLSQGEKLDIGYSLTDGSGSYYTLLEVPTNENNGSLSFEYRQLDTRIIEEPFDDFNIQTEGQRYGISYRQPLFRKASNNRIEAFSISTTASYFQSASTLSGIPFPISMGANSQGRTQIFEVSLSQEYIQQTRRNIIALNSQLALGLDVMDEASEREPDGEYLLWRGQGLWIQNLGSDRQLKLDADVQFASDSLLPIRQLTLAGPTSVRGYWQDSVTSDNGMVLSTELKLPLATNQRSDQQLSAIPFVDLGVGWNNGDRRRVDNGFLASVGLGIQYEWNDLTARANYAIPLLHTDSEGRSLQESGLNFSVGYQLSF